MSGHSKWKNIMHKKEKTDAQRAKVFTKIGKEIAVAVREGGADPTSNTRLRDLIIKAKQNNVPNDNIDRTIKKASGADSVIYEEISYEGYGPSGVAVIVETTTDNRNRTASDIRHYFDKYGGNLGQTGCVGYLFSDKGVIVLEREDDTNEDKLMEACLEAGAEDVLADEEIFEIYTSVSDVYAISEELKKQGYNIVSSDVSKIPSNYIKLEDDEAIRQLSLLLEHLDDNDDVAQVYHNCENDLD